MSDDTDDHEPEPTSPAYSPHGDLRITTHNGVAIVTRNDVKRFGGILSDMFCASDDGADGDGHGGEIMEATGAEVDLRRFDPGQTFLFRDVVEIALALSFWHTPTWTQLLQVAVLADALAASKTFWGMFQAVAAMRLACAPPPEQAGPPPAPEQHLLEAARALAARMTGVTGAESVVAGILVALVAGESGVTVTATDVKIAQTAAATSLFANPVFAALLTCVLVHDMPAARAAVRDYFVVNAAFSADAFCNLTLGAVCAARRQPAAWQRYVNLMCGFDQPAILAHPIDRWAVKPILRVSATLPPVERARVQDLVLQFFSFHACLVDLITSGDIDTLECIQVTPEALKHGGRDPLPYYSFLQDRLFGEVIVYPLRYPWNAPVDIYRKYETVITSDLQHGEDARMARQKRLLRAAVGAGVRLEFEMIFDYLEEAKERFPSGPSRLGALIILVRWFKAAVDEIISSFSGGDGGHALAWTSRAGSWASTAEHLQARISRWTELTQPEIWTNADLRHAIERLRQAAVSGRDAAGGART